MEDALAAERLSVVQFQDLAQHCTDPQLKALCQQIASQNLSHFERLLRLLNQGQGGQGTYQVGANQVGAGAWSGFPGGSFQQ